MRLSGGGLASDQQRGGPGRPGHGEGDDAKEQGELARGDEPGVLKVEASGLGVAEETFDDEPLSRHWSERQWRMRLR